MGPLPRLHFLQRRRAGLADAWGERLDRTDRHEHEGGGQRSQKT
jgi:hypothetical protein